MNSRVTIETQIRNRFSELEATLAALERDSDSLSRQRLGAFLGGLVGVLAGLAVHNTLAAGVVLVTLALFSYLVLRHRRVASQIQWFEANKRLLSTRLARLRLDWDGIPPSRASVDANHPFAHDLDIIGDFSLHRLLDGAASSGGGARLLDWLTTLQPEIRAISARQSHISELLRLREFRDRLTLFGQLYSSDHRRQNNPDSLLDWINAVERAPITTRSIALASALASVNVTLFVLTAIAGVPPVWIVSFAVYVAVSVTLLRRVGDQFQKAASLKSQIDRTYSVFHQIETLADEDAPRLHALSAPFLAKDRQPSAEFGRLRVIVSAMSLRFNPIIWFALNAIAPWDIVWSWRLAARMEVLADRAPKWFDIWYELEALSSLATFSELNPGYQAPNVDDDRLFDAEDLGHPMLPHDQRVCNDFAFDKLGDAVIVTGSNMSGKSVFLRTIGVNLVLAYAGAVVCARRFDVGRFRLQTSINLSDSLIDAFSFFYAEVRRLKEILDAVHKDDETTPVFFLIDEIFRGTNNRERLIGAQSCIQALVGSNGVGLISTHDLELVNLAPHSANIQNRHFREEVIAGKMVFDYRLRSGPSPTTNALKIMQLEGLPIVLGDMARG